MEEDMTEIWDIYDRYGNRTGRTMKRGIPKEGDYMFLFRSVRKIKSRIPVSGI